jgi:oligopeptide/dipeptide ABC transporter ATP-binding protein
VTALLDVRELSTVFRLQAGTVRAVNGVSFSINKGRSLAIVGESGCGKSASALSVMRLVPPPGEIVGGQVLFNGVDLLGLPEKDLRAIRGRDIAMIFQDPMTSLNPVLAIGEQLSEALRWHRRMPMAAARQQVIETLALVGIADPAGRFADYPHQFSGGQRQRIMIAMAIVCSPALLIADEPTTALDVTIQAQIVELIAELQSKLGMAVVWITHDLALAGRIVDEVAVMYAGRIVEYGSVDDIFSSPGHPYTAGLLASMPRFDRPGELRLASIDGSPPDLGNLPAGCAFAPRCPRQVERCVAETPVLEQMGERRRVACWQKDRS